MYTYTVNSSHFKTNFKAMFYNMYPRNQYYQRN